MGRFFYWQDFRISPYGIHLFLRPLKIRFMKYLFILIAAITLASCGTDTTASDAQDKVDSIVTSKTAILENQFKNNNDSIINAMAMARADSMMNKTAATAPVTMNKPNDTIASAK
jgi:hypothetical protein